MIAISISIAFYLLTALGLFKQNSRHNLSILNASLLGAALIFHALDLSNMINGNAVNFNLYYSSSMTLWWVALLFSLLMIKSPLNMIASLLYGFIALVLLINQFFLDTTVKRVEFDTAIHIFLSIIAYSFLFLTFFQSIFTAIQNNALHNKTNLFITPYLPPLETMEKLLFQLLTIGLILLTLSLISGFLFLEDLFAQHLVHKTVLSIIAWLMFLIIFLRHRRFGWRSKQSRLVIQIAFVLLLLGYSGSKFVLEQILL